MDDVAKKRFDNLDAKVDTLATKVDALVTKVDTLATKPELSAVRIELSDKVDTKIAELASLTVAMGQRLDNALGSLIATTNSIATLLGDVHRKQEGELTRRLETLERQVADLLRRSPS